MTRRLSRRSIVTATLGAVLIASPAVLRADQPIRVRTVDLSTGLSIIFSRVMAAKRFDLRHGIDLSPVAQYPSLGTYYADFIAGRFDVAMGSFDVFALRYLAGVQARFIGNYATADMIEILTSPNGPKSIAELRGKTLAVTTQSGVYRSVKAFVRKFHGLVIEKDISIQNSDNPSGTLTLLLADRVDAALSWGPPINVALARNPELRTLYNLGRELRERGSIEWPVFIVAAQQEILTKHPGIGARIHAAYADCAAAIMKNPEEAASIAAGDLGYAPGILVQAFTSKRLVLVAQPANDPATREMVRNAAAVYHEEGAFPSAQIDGFFADFG
jgi:NitT/TauT family transport system substrate-binding protein